MFKSINNGKLPVISTTYSAGADIFSNETVEIKAGEIRIVKSGVVINQDMANNIKSQYFVMLAIRSSLAKKGLILMNGIGVIDMDYPDDIGVMLYNPISDIMFEDRKVFGVNGKESYVINKGDKIAQLIVIPHATPIYYHNIEDEIRQGGFGSTDKI